MYYDSVTIEADVEVVADDVVLDPNMRNITEEANFAAALEALQNHAQTSSSLAFLRHKKEAERQSSMSLGQRIGDFAIRGAIGLALKAFVK